MTDPIDYPKEYDNSGRVPNAAELIDKYITDAAEFREQPDRLMELDLSYGPAERNRVDVFWPADDAGKAKKSPIVVFIHGGYWQRLDRSAFSHMAKGLNERGIAVALPSYTLCPDIDIEGIINEMRRACLVLFQTYKRKLTVIGHSAGGHLAACMMATDWEGIHPELPEDLVCSGMGISGLYELTPLLHTPVNDAVQMDERQAIAASPVEWVPEASQRFEAWVGGDESNEYHRQSRTLSNRWTMLGTPTNYVSEPGQNHFTVIDALTRADSTMVETIVGLVAEPQVEVTLPDVDEAEVTAQLQDFMREGEKASKPTSKAKASSKKSKKSSAEKKKKNASDQQESTESKDAEPEQPAKKASSPVLKASIGGKAPLSVKKGKSPSPKEKPSKPA